MSVIPLDPQVNDLISVADTDGDGVINYLEFVSLMMNLNNSETSTTNLHQRSGSIQSSRSCRSAGSMEKGRNQTWDVVRERLRNLSKFNSFLFDTWIPDF